MKKYKGFLAGMLTTLVIVALVGNASATLGKITKELEYRNIKVSLDGEVLDLKDSAGNHVEPFMFDGTNYLPVRALAEALGLDVAWDGSTNTVVLTTGDAPKTAPEDPAEQTKGQLLASKEHVRIYFLGFEDVSDGCDLKFRFENESDYTVTCNAFVAEIGGKRDGSGAYVKIDSTYTPPTVNPGEQAEAVLHLAKEDLIEKGAENFKGIRVGFSGTAKVTNPDFPEKNTIQLFWVKEMTLWR